MSVRTSQVLRHTISWLAVIPPWFVFTVGVSLTIAIAAQFVGLQRAIEQTQFDRACAAVQENVAERVRIYSYGLRGARSLFIADPNAGRDTFMKYLASRDMAREFPGMETVGVLERVPRADLPEFVQAVRQSDHDSAFDVIQQARSGDAYVVRYAKSLKTGVIMSGIDFSGNTAAVEMAEGSSSRREPTLSTVQSTANDPNTSLVMYAHVIGNDDRSVGGSSHRRWVYATIQINEMFREPRRIASDLVDFQITDTSADGQASVISKWGLNATPPNASMRTASFPISAAGRNWTLTIVHRPRAGLQASRVIPLTILMTGTLAALAGAAIVRVRRGCELRARNLADRSSRELRRLSTAMEDAVEGISQLDASGRYVSVNAAYAGATGMTPEELVGMSWEKTVHPDDLEIVRTAFQEMLRSGRSSAEVRGAKKNGEIFYKHVTIVAIRDEAGTYLGNFCFRKDVTERRLAEEALRKSRELLNCVLESSLEGVMVFGAIRTPASDESIEDFEILLCNPAAECIVGRQATEMVGNRMLTLFPGNKAVGLFDRYVAVVESGAPLTLEQHYCRDGLDAWFHITAVRVGDGLAVTFADVSKQKRDAANALRYTAQLEEARDALAGQASQLETARRAAESGSEAKGNFLANMSHEIRTPLAAILGHADLMLDPTRSMSSNLDGLQAIRRNGQHLLELVSDVLDLSKIEANQMTVEHLPTPLPRLVAEAVSITRPKAMEKGLTIAVRFSSRVPRSITTDPLRLRQILINLIGNAIKFTEAGSVLLNVTCSGAGANGSVLRIDVTDTGIGIDEAARERLFRPFNQADVSTTRKFGGTGLGLTLSRSFAQLLGGDIMVESTPGVGSTFTVTIPLGIVAAENFVAGAQEAAGEESPSAALPATLPVRLDGSKVLLAEDGIDNQTILAAYVRSAGAEVDIAANGREAVQFALASVHAGRPYDLVLMDMQMPELDGYGAASELRRRGYHSPIVALTAHAMSSDREKCMRSGCDDYMSKPVQRRSLLELIKRTIERGTTMQIESDHSETRLASGTETTLRGPILRSPLADEPDFSDALAQFVSRLPNHVWQIQRCLETGQVGDLARVAHKLRGAGGSYELPEVSDRATAVEDKLAAQCGLSEVKTELAQLIDTLRRVEGYDAAQETESLAA